jgi:integrase
VETFAERDGAVGAAERLSATKVAKLRQPGKYGDGRGLWLYVGAVGGRSWVYRYMCDGVAREMGLGPCSDISLQEARERARAARKQILDGLDPLQARRDLRAKAKLESARGVTFKEAAQKYVAAHEAGWTAKHCKQWSATLATCHPVFGSLPVAAIDTAMVMKVLEPTWRRTPETASRLRGRIEAVLDWAKVRGFRAGENPARWRGHLDHLLPATTKVRRVVHLPALSYAEVPEFIADLRRRDGVAARALEFTILCASRSGEVVGARWDEIDVAAKIWTVPAARMKARRKHRVPLSDRALAILAAMPCEKGNDHVFIGARAGKPVADKAMAKLLKSMPGRGGITVHGFRSSFRDFAAERTAFPREVVEAALAHVVGDKVEAAYRRSDLFERRRRLMRDWARFCETQPKGEVIPLRSADHA